MGQLIVSD